MSGAKSIWDASDTSVGNLDCLSVLLGWLKSSFSFFHNMLQTEQINFSVQSLSRVRLFATP